MSDGLLIALKALADPLRLRVVAALSQEELAVGELAQVLGTSQPRVSHHLRALREAQIVRTRKEGTWTFCRLNDEGNGDGSPDLLTALRPWREELQPSPADLQRLQEVLEQRRERSRLFFDEAAGRWDRHEPRLAGDALRYQALSLLLQRDATLADIGCGTGFMARALSARARKVILIDHSPAMLERARTELGSGNGAELDFRTGELDNLPLQNGEVDAAFVNLALHHVPDLKGTLRELRRVVRPGGSLIVSDLLPHDVESLREDHADLRLGLDPDRLAASLAEAGFRDVVCEKCEDSLWATNGEGQDELLPLFLMRADKGERP